MQRKVKFDTTVPVRVRGTAYPFRRGSDTEPDQPEHAVVEEIVIDGYPINFSDAEGSAIRELEDELLRCAQEEEDADAVQAAGARGLK